MSSSQNVNAPTVVSAPFLPPNGDVVLRSCDGQDFSVVKAILEIASPFSQSPFSLPQPENQTAVPIISVPEDARTLDTPLRLCYPLRTPIVDDLELAGSVLAAALKYEMEFAVQDLCRVLVSQETLEMQAVRIYAIACRFRLVEEVRLAAIASLRAPIEDVYVKEFETLPTIYFFKLLKFHRTVKTDICTVLQEAVEGYSRTSQAKIDAIVVRCTSTYECGRIGRGSVASWWKAFITDQVIPLVQSAPLSRDLFSFQNPPRAAEVRCSVCTTNMGAQMGTAICRLRELFNKAAAESAAEQLKF